MMWLSFLLLCAFSVAFGCQDYEAKCVTWKKHCQQPLFRYYMELNCKETCNLCPKCEDKLSTCSSRLAYCNDPSNKQYMEKNCALSCNFCQGPTTAPPTTTTPAWTVIPAGQCGIPKVATSRVINGVDATPNTWPWQVLIKYFDAPHCGGSIISPFHVVTAAHCISGKEDFAKYFTVVVGEHNFDVAEGPEITVGVSKLITHKQFKFATLDYDIAILKLNMPIPFSKTVATVCLPEKDEIVPVGAECFITGWGKILPSSYMHHTLQQAKLPVVDNARCRALNTNTTNIPVTSRMLCAGYGQHNPTGGCQGDSGGPFVCRRRSGSWVLQGAVSWGSKSCNSTQAFTVFTRITSFTGWLKNNMMIM